MRRMHLYPMRWLSEERGRRFYKNYKDQNRLARRIGLKLLRAVYFLFVAAILLQLTYAVAVTMNEKGWLRPPKFEDRVITQS